jgi:hypothetical protein
MPNPMKRIHAMLVATLMLLPFVANAQSAGISPDRDGRTSLVSANPIGLLFQWYNGEIEHAVSPTVSIAAAGSSYDFTNDTKYTSVDAIARYYPGARSVKGFSVGLSLGYIYLKDQSYSAYDCIGCSRSNGSTGTIGVRADYVWVLGRDQRFAAAMGIGAKRLFSDDLDTEGVPIGRLSIGYAW